jgi:hypothetical protein
MEDTWIPRDPAASDSQRSLRILLFWSGHAVLHQVNAHLLDSVLAVVGWEEHLPHFNDASMRRATPGGFPEAVHDSDS